MRSCLDKEELDPYYPFVVYYIPSINRFADHEWNIIHDLYDLFATWQVNNWKRQRQDSIMTTWDGLEIMMYYLNYEEEEIVMDYMAVEEHYEIKRDRYNHGGFNPYGYTNGRGQY